MTSIRQVTLLNLQWMFRDNQTINPIIPLLYFAWILSWILLTIFQIQWIVMWVKLSIKNNPASQHSFECNHIKLTVNRETITFTNFVCVHFTVIVVHYFFTIAFALGSIPSSPCASIMDVHYIMDEHRSSNVGWIVPLELSKTIFFYKNTKLSIYLL